MEFLTRNLARLELLRDADRNFPVAGVEAIGDIRHLQAFKQAADFVEHVVTEKIREDVEHRSIVDIEDFLQQLEEHNKPARAIARLKVHPNQPTEIDQERGPELPEAALRSYLEQRLCGALGNRREPPTREPQAEVLSLQNDAALSARHVLPSNQTSIEVLAPTNTFMN